MNITDYFIEKGLMVVPEVTDDRFQMVDDGGVETSTGELLHSFIRRLRPEHVLETGTYTGISSLYMGQALKENGIGTLETIEIDEFHIKRARELWDKMGVFNIQTIHLESLKFEPSQQYQFMFLDSEPWLRFQELVKFYPNLDEGGYIFVHDTPRNLCQGNVNPDHPDYKSWPFGDVPEKFKELLKNRELMPFYFGGARGLVGFYKVHKDDFI